MVIERHLWIYYTRQGSIDNFNPAQLNTSCNLGFYAQEAIRDYIYDGLKEKPRYKHELWLQTTYITGNGFQECYIYPIYNGCRSLEFLILITETPLSFDWRGERPYFAERIALLRYPDIADSKGIKDEWKVRLEFAEEHDFFHAKEE
jgi:hypothetical protein